MMRTLLLPLTLLAGFCCAEVNAACTDWNLYQTIEISKNADGKPYVVDKANSEKCLIKNNRLPDRLQSSHLNWVFKNLDCKKNHCRIEFHGDHARAAKALSCVNTNANYSVCRVQVNALKDYCNKYDKLNNVKCTVSYNIKVGEKTIDPSIIIRPRPY